MENVIYLKSEEDLLAIVIKSTYSPEITTFITDDNQLQQAGFVVYPKGGEILAHSHNPIERHIIGTPETLIVRKGSVLARIYNKEKILVEEIILLENDIIMLIDGGHGFDVLEDTILFEIKQGPYTGLIEKERF